MWPWGITIFRYQSYKVFLYGMGLMFSRIVLTLHDTPALPFFHASCELRILVVAPKIRTLREGNMNNYS